MKNNWEREGGGLDREGELINFLPLKSGGGGLIRGRGLVGGGGLNRGFFLHPDCTYLTRMKILSMLSTGYVLIIAKTNVS